MVAFRSASKGDYKAIATLHANSWQQNYRGVFSDRFLDDGVMADRLSVWKDRLENGSRDQFVTLAEIDGRLVGFVCGFFDDHPKYGALIDNLHVDSGFIGRRIGEKLMVRAAEFLRNSGKTTMYLWVLTNNTKAIRFYERIGGKPLETIDDFDIGDREITKTRYHWPDLDFILALGSKKTTNEY